MLLANVFRRRPIASCWSREEETRTKGTKAGRGGKTKLDARKGEQTLNNELRAGCFSIFSASLRLHFSSTELTLGRQDAVTIKDRQLTDSVARSSTSHPRIPATRAQTSGRPTREQGIKEKAAHSKVTKCVILEAQCAVSRFPGDHPVHHILKSSVSLHGGLTPLHLTAATRARRASTEGP